MMLCSFRSKLFFISHQHYRNGGHMNTLEALPDRLGDQKAGIRKCIWQTIVCRVAATGQGLVEYALILALIAIVVIGVLTELGGQTSQIFSSVSCTLDGGAVANTTTTGPGNSGAHTGASGGAAAAGSVTTGGC
jgi:pilus assembly protein Flp/PilA